MKCSEYGCKAKAVGWVQAEPVCAWHFSKQKANQTLRHKSIRKWNEEFRKRK